MRPKSRRFLRSAWPALCCVAAALGCSRTPSVVSPHRPPGLTLTAERRSGQDSQYSIRLQWQAASANGRVRHFQYALDPPPGADTAWVTTERTELSLVFEGEGTARAEASSDPVAVRAGYHTFVLRAIDDAGSVSATRDVSFHSTSIAPWVSLTSPSTRGGKVLTGRSFLASWEGGDLDGAAAGSGLRYRSKLVRADEITAPLGPDRDPTAAEIQAHFESDAPGFESWQLHAADALSRSIEEWPQSEDGYLAVVALDETGAFSPRFVLGRNVLAFRTSAHVGQPHFRIWNSRFQTESRPQPVADASDASARTRLEVAEGERIEFHWAAVGSSPRGERLEFRWALLSESVELPGSPGIPAASWSAWSADSRGCSIGPLPDLPGDRPHVLLVQARNGAGAVTSVAVEMRAQGHKGERPLLIVDDFGGTPDRLPDLQPYGLFPTEAVLDTLLYAVGNVPHRFRPEGTLSDPGVFAGFDYDTLDYRFFPTNGIPLSVLQRYAGVLWLTGSRDAANRNEKFKTVVGVMAALRWENSIFAQNAPATYLERRGRIFFFGDGIAAAIANGYVSRFDTFTAPLPYRSDGPVPAVDNILVPGNFLFDYLKARSQVNASSLIPPSSGGPESLVDAIPYLPQYRTPGAPWPPVDWAGGRGPYDDPRVGPSSERHLARWDGLPLLTITTEFADWPGAPPPPFIQGVPYISLPNHIADVRGNGRGPDATSTLDTLYLHRSQEYDLNPAPGNSDGKPVAFYYQGKEHGEVGWTGLPLWHLERTQVRQFMDVLLRNWGMVRNPDPAQWTGPGSAHDRRFPGTNTAAAP